METKSIDHEKHCGNSHDHNHHHKHQHSHSKSIIDMDSIAYNSALSGVNAGLKMMFSIMLLVVAISFNSIWFSVSMTVAMLFLLRYSARLEMHEIFKLMAIPIVFIIISCVTIIVQISAESIVGAWEITVFGLYFFVTKATIMQGVALFFRAYSAVQCLYFLATTTSINEIILAMQRLKFPKVLIELMYMIYRYIFVLLEVQSKLKISALSRLGYSSYKASWRSFGGIASGVLVGSFERSSSCFYSLESRGYDGEINFYCSETKIKARHVVLMATFFVALLAVGIIFSVLGV